MATIRTAVKDEYGGVMVTRDDGSGFYLAAASDDVACDEFNAWLDGGGQVTTAALAAETVGVPARVSMAQARIALRHAGLLDRIEAGISSLPDVQREDVLTAWEYASEVSRDGALVSALAGLFGLDAATLDALFVAAAAIEL